MKARGVTAITLAFATGECGSESWGIIPGAAMAQANASMLSGAGVDYILSTGGAGGVFICGSDAGFSTFIDRWMSPHLKGVDLDIEAGQTQAAIDNLVARVKAARSRYPGLRFSLTISTGATNGGSPTARSLGAGAPNNLTDAGSAVVGSALAQFGTCLPGIAKASLRCHGLRCPPPRTTA